MKEDVSTWCSRAKRENMNDPAFSFFHGNINRITHSYHKKITRTATLEYYENLTRASLSNTGTMKI